MDDDVNVDEIFREPTLCLNVHSGTERDEPKEISNCDKHFLHEGLHELRYWHSSGAFSIHSWEDTPVVTTHSSRTITPESPHILELKHFMGDPEFSAAWDVDVAPHVDLNTDLFGIYVGSRGLCTIRIFFQTQQKCAAYYPTLMRFVWFDVNRACLASIAAYTG